MEAIIKDIELEKQVEAILDVREDISDVCETVTKIVSDITDCGIEDILIDAKLIEKMGDFSEFVSNVSSAVSGSRKKLESVLNEFENIDKTLK